ncbi:hypothetical protein FJ934_01845 [Mesorhizobium sp. B2-4-12]|uniref:hypothetical protein n=1 Tax=unclassified Mesorhizobium TaxID=325217 RepID=UPI001128711E|nr:MULTISPECIES: hypothetical protein [unclassified Mesorhizobium]TPK99217.1 hypothetical protein FJ934_01845 [Mesorhizobium sp. B2-4-12]TPL08304.1 hypothetical protein FJ938_08590 [Mesorhizobium sp. B2-4-14]
MSLDIPSQDILVDEPTDLTDDDVDPSIAPDSANTTPQYLPSRYGLGGLTSPEVIFQADFVQATANVAETISAVAAPSAWMGSGDHRKSTANRNAPAHWPLSREVHHVNYHLRQSH